MAGIERRVTLALVVSLSMSAAAHVRAVLPADQIRFTPGPYILLDERLAARTENLQRAVQRLQRNRTGPVVTGPTDRNTQPYVTVLRDPKSGKFRMWYDCSDDRPAIKIGYIESVDGVNWEGPHRVLHTPFEIQTGASVIDDGSRDKPEERYKLGYWHDGGLNIATSPDGIEWKPLVHGVALRHNLDITNIYRDGDRGYFANISFYLPGKAWSGKRRITFRSASSDLQTWSKPELEIAPDANDEGETQFYGMSGMLRRGGTLVGLVKVLRDDLPADTGGKAQGIGYTVLAWSHDGTNWTRERAPWLDRDTRLGAWDHAMAWGDCQVLVGDTLFVYYGGYKRGHKIERYRERQIGLATAARDRYLAYEAGAVPGTYTSMSGLLAASRLTINTDARGGEIRAQIVGSDAKPIPGYRFTDCVPVRTDSIQASINWKRPLQALFGKRIAIQFRLIRARIFAFDFAAR